MGRDQRSEGLFDDVAIEYDLWYDAHEGSRVFAEELACLRLVVPELIGDWVEIGVGTGRFAASLGISRELDPSAPMLSIAASRGIRTQVGVAEDLPYAGNSFDGMLMVSTLCFVTNASHALGECARVLRPGGILLIGHIPSDGPWGREYVRRGREGHPVYSHARFTTVDMVVGFASDEDFNLDAAASALFWRPGYPPADLPRIESGIVPGAGFVALKLRSPNG